MIPIALVALVRLRKDVPFNWIFFMFSSFILSCGFTHVVHTIGKHNVLEIFTFLQGPWLLHSDDNSLHNIVFHWLHIAIKVFTGVISFTTALATIALLPSILQLPSPAMLRLQVQERIRAENKWKRQYQIGKLTSTIVSYIRNRIQLDDVVQTAVEQLGRALHAPCSIHVRERSTSTILKCKASWAHDTSMQSPMIPITPTIANAMEQEVPTVIEHDDTLLFSTLLQHFKSTSSTTSILFARCKPCNSNVNDDSMFLILYANRNRTWSAEELTIVAEVANQLSVAVEQAYLLEQEKQKHELEIRAQTLEQLKQAAEAENKAKTECMLMYFSPYVSHVYHVS